MRQCGSPGAGAACVLAGLCVLMSLWLEARPPCSVGVPRPLSPGSLIASDVQEPPDGDLGGVTVIAVPLA